MNSPKHCAHPFCKYIKLNEESFEIPYWTIKMSLPQSLSPYLSSSKPLIFLPPPFALRDQLVKPPCSYPNLSLHLHHARITCLGLSRFTIPLFLSFSSLGTLSLSLTNYLNSIRRVSSNSNSMKWRMKRATHLLFQQNYCLSARLTGYPIE